MSFLDLLKTPVWFASIARDASALVCNKSILHSGFRAYSRKYLTTIRFMENSDDFVFDTEIIAQGIACKLHFWEVPIVTRYFQEASSINFRRSVIYRLGILRVLFQYFLHQAGVLRQRRFLAAQEI